LLDEIRPILGASMSSILFLLAVIAFMVVVYWAFLNDRAGGESGARGFLAMRDAGDPQAVPPRRSPRWASARLLETGRPLSQPRWRDAAKPGGWRA
jgi:hypothetical protein